MAVNELVDTVSQGIRRIELGCITSEGVVAVQKFEGHHTVVSAAVVLLEGLHIFEEEEGNMSTFEGIKEGNFVLEDIHFLTFQMKPNRHSASAAV